MDFTRVRTINKRIIREAGGSGSGLPEPPPGTPGLTGVAYYPLDGTTGDAAGEHDGTLVGDPAYVAAHRGQALDLNGCAGR
jgi:hypothetical protein